MRGIDCLHIKQMFEGTFFRDEKRGHGSYHFAEGRVLESEFNPMPSQISKIILSNGSVYFGEQKNGSREGAGKITYLDGSNYDGEWR